MRNDAAASGFTLLETLIVLVIAGLLLGLVVSRGPLHSARAEFLRARGQVVTVLRAARLEARLSGRPVRVDLVRGALLTRRDGRVTARQGLGAHVMVWERAHRGMRFLPDGTGQEAVWRVSVGRLSARISVSALTGRIRVDAS